MLLAREKKIVTLLIEHEDKLTTTQIATSLKVSSRTIKADIKKINEELEKHSCRINSQQGVGLWIEYDNHEAKKYLKEVTRDTADLYLSPEVRKYHLAVELLLQDDYTSMEALAKEYYISKAMKTTYRELKTENLNLRPAWEMELQSHIVKGAV